MRHRKNERATTAALCALVASLAVLAGCQHSTAGRSDAPTVALTSTVTVPVTPPRSTIVSTPTPKITATAPAAEIDKPCPYASNDDFRDAEGDRTTHSVQLAGAPIGCRYYFEYDPTVIIGEIRVQTFGTSTEAFNAVAVLAKNHPEAYSVPGIGDGAVLLKLPLQGNDTWACVFAKGRLAVIAHSRQTSVAQDARNIAQLIAPVVH